ncbi:MAG: 6-phosphofructokinase, partial [Spirochaetales bacterium]|nr:6-phosphofructokinase [Spirochaetales bacterium]
MLKKDDLIVKTLGEPRYDSPLDEFTNTKEHKIKYISDDDRFLFLSSEKKLNEYVEKLKNGEDGEDIIPSFEKAGPRQKIYFKPGETISAVVTCGGLCPGLNSVIRALVYMNYYRYNNRLMYGIRYGYEGFIDKHDHSIINLTPDVVENIHKLGGTILGSSRGPQNADEIVDKLVKLKVNILYVIGGDGTLRGASGIVEAIERRNLKISV